MTELCEDRLCDPGQRSTAIHCQKFEPALEAFTWPAKAENWTLAKATTPKICLRLFGAAHKNTWEDQSFSLGLEGIKSHRKYLQSRKKKRQLNLRDCLSASQPRYIIWVKNSCSLCYKWHQNTNLAVIWHLQHRCCCYKKSRLLPWNHFSLSQGMDLPLLEEHADIYAENLLQRKLFLLKPFQFHSQLPRPYLHRWQNHGHLGQGAHHHHCTGSSGAGES